eukprot:1492725-Rhodomonas_salina.2
MCGQILVDFESYVGDCACPDVTEGHVLYDQLEPVSERRSAVAAEIKGIHMGEAVRVDRRSRIMMG